MMNRIVVEWINDGVLTVEVIGNAHTDSTDDFWMLTYSQCLEFHKA